MAKVILFGLATIVFCLQMRAVAQEKDKKKTEPKKPANVWTNPTDAPIDYKIQGEYATKGKAAQVVACGNGKFDVCILDGGLPGDGWNPKSQKIKIEAKLDTEKGIATISSGGLLGTIDPKTGKLEAQGKEVKPFSLTRVERKSPTISARPPEGAIILFDGSNADAWNGKKMVGDLLGVPNTTKRDFTNFKLHIEFRTPFQPTGGGQWRGNSGVYVCGREVQVLDSFGLKGQASNDCGAIYSIRAPNVNMCFPPLAWQTYEIVHRAGKVDPKTKKQGLPTITVHHNGVLIHENVELKGSANSGNIYLQNHGDPVVYRNVWLVELK
jgi:hypothetical protein